MSYDKQVKSFEILKLNIADLINNNHIDILIKLAEEIGYELGTLRGIKFNSIYKMLINTLDILIKSNNIKNDIYTLAIIKSKIAYIIARSVPRDRAAIDLFYDKVSDAIHCILEADGEDVIFKLNLFHTFIEVVYCYQQYSLNAGFKHGEFSENALLRDKVRKMQLELNKLLKFVYSSTKNAKVFMSYARNDKIFVEKLKNDLENQNIETWFDEKDLCVGDVQSETIAEGVRQSWFFLIVLSSNSIESDWVKFELDEAYDDHIRKKKKILPVLIGNLTNEQIPRRLQKHMYADFRDNKNYGIAFEKLLQSIIKESSKKNEAKLLNNK